MILRDMVGVIALVVIEVRKVGAGRLRRMVIRGRRWSHGCVRMPSTRGLVTRDELGQ